MLSIFFQLPPVVLARVIIGVALAFVVVPALVLPRPASARTSLDAVVIRSVRWMAIALVLVLTLAILRMFHVIPLMLIFAYLWYRKQRRTEGFDAGKLVSLPHELFLRFTDTAERMQEEGRAAAHVGLAGRLRRLIGAPVRWIEGAGLRERLVLGVPIVGVLGASLWLRVGDAFNFETLSPPEAYVFLTWAKALVDQQIFVDGLYPYGLPAFIAFLDKAVAGVDIYETVRYTGPIVTSLIICGLFYAVLRLTANPGAAVLAAGAFGLFGTMFYWHEPWTRQAGPLPHELGLAVALFTLPFAVLAVTERNREHVTTVGAGALAVGLIHPVPLGLLLGLVVAGVIGAVIGHRGGGAQAVRTIGAALVGGALSFAWFPIGLLAGIPVFRGLDSPFQALDIELEPFLVGAYATSAIGHTPLSIIGGVGVVLAVLAGLVLLRRLGRPVVAAQMVGLACAAAVAVVLYDVRWLPLPTNILAPLGNITGVTVALALGVGFAAVTSIGLLYRDVLRRTVVILALAGVGLGSIGNLFPLGPTLRAPSEYETMANITREIMRSQDAFTYTIVGTPQQRQAVQGVGTFVELWVFARDVTLRDARDPGFVLPDASSLLFAADLGETLPIPTADIYLFVEKIPFPVPEAEPVGPTEEFYYDREKRGRIMAAVFGWAEFYRFYQTDMTVFYEDDEIIVYRIRRRPNIVAAAASPLFKDYSWQPGVLFEAGPAEPEEVEIPWLDD